MIEISRLIHDYPAEAGEPLRALQGVDLVIGSGEFVALLGPNGCGKTTLAKHMNALLLPSSGTVRVDGMDTAEPEHLWEVRRRVGMVFQDPDAQMVATVVEEELAFGPENLGIPPREIQRRVAWALEALGIADLRRCEPHLLSGGQKQRVAIAAVLVMEPRYLVMDEPTAMLDPLGRREVLEALGQLHRDLGISVVYVTHHMEEVLAASRAVVMEAGRVALEGAPGELFRRAGDLRDLGLDVPPVADLAGRLRARGLAVPEDAVGEEGLAAALLALSRAGRA